MKLKQTINKLAQSSWSHVATSFILMGGWAFFANRVHGVDASIMAALLQGTLSGIITLGMKKALERIYQAFKNKGDDKAAFFLTPLIVCSMSASTLLLCHFIAGTPELILTIITPSSVALFYAYIYTYTLKKLGAS